MESQEKGEKTIGARFTPVASGRGPTEQEVEQVRVYINDAHTKKLKEELPYISRYFETIQQIWK